MEAKIINDQLTFLISRNIFGRLEKIIIIWENLKLFIDPKKIIESLSVINRADYPLKNMDDFEDIRQKFRMMTTIKNLVNGVDYLMDNKNYMESTVAESRKLFKWYFKQFSENLASDIKRDMRNLETINILTTCLDFNDFSTRSVTQHKISFKIQHHHKIIDWEQAYGKMLHYIVVFAHSEERKQCFFRLKKMYTLQTGNNLLDHPVWQHHANAYQLKIRRQAEFFRQRQLIVRRQLQILVEARFAEFHRFRAIIQQTSPLAG